MDTSNVTWRFLLLSRKMLSVKLVAIFLCFFVKNIHGKCYSDFCHNVTTFSESVSDYTCELTRFQKNNNCIDYKFKNVGGKPQDVMLSGKFELNAYVATVDAVHVHTAFNFTIKNITFHKLIMRYQSIADQQFSACRHIHLYGNETHPAPTELFISCPFSDSSYETLPYRLEYLVVGKAYVYSRQLIFHVPEHLNIDTNDITKYTPFIYVDVSDSNSVILYIQPAPKKLNVTRFIVWFINTDINYVDKTIIASGTDEGHIAQHFYVYGGKNYFKVAAMHPDCSETKCRNSTSPPIERNYLNQMIVHFVWLLCTPPVLLYLIWYICKFHRTRKFVKVLSKKPNCLLVYSPTREFHINVMVQLATYLRRCNINAMIDVLDIPKATTKDPCLWCSRAFHKADIVIIATSPKSNNTDVPIIYKNVDNHALRLMKENYPRRNKRYLAIQFPYCKTDDIPEEAKDFKRLNLPDDLGKLISTIYNVDMNLHGVSNDELLKSIKDALDNVHQDVTSGLQVYMDSDAAPLISSTTGAMALSDGNKQMEIMDVADLNTVNKSDVIDPSQYCMTNIAELCLLGHSHTEDKDNGVNDVRKSDTKFCIDQLDL